MALWVRASYAPVTAAGELQAKLSRLSSYTLRLKAPLKLERRDRWAIRSRPAGGASRWPYVVLVQHSCGAVWPVDNEGLVKLIMMNETRQDQRADGVMHHDIPY
jgi:hypothetical protein